MSKKHLEQEVVLALIGNVERRTTVEAALARQSGHNDDLRTRIDNLESDLADANEESQRLRDNSRSKSSICQEHQERIKKLEARIVELSSHKPKSFICQEHQECINKLEARIVELSSHKQFRVLVRDLSIDKDIALTITEVRHELGSTTIHVRMPL